MEEQQAKKSSITSDYILPFLDNHKVLYRFITIFLLIIVGFLVYQNIFDNTFHFDDTVWMNLEQVQNEDYAHLHKLNTFRIIPFATFTFDLHQFGDDPTGFYYTNTPTTPLVITTLVGVCGYYFERLIYVDF